MGPKAKHGARRYLHEEPCSGFFGDTPNNLYTQVLPDEITLAKEPPLAPVHSGGSSASEFEARVVAAGLARILPDLKKEEICDLDTLCSLQEDDLKELGLAVGARVKLMRLIRELSA